MKRSIYVSILILALASSQLNAQKTWDLEGCIDYAITNNLTVQQAKLDIERSDINLTQSKYGLLPNLNAQASYGYNFGQRIDPFTNQFASQQVATGNFFMSSTVDLFNGFSKINTIKQNKESFEASKYDLDRIRNDISLQLCLAYLNILRAKENVAIGQQQLALTDKQVQRMVVLVEAGQEPQGSLYDTQAQQAQESFNLITAQNAQAISTLNLTQLMQLDPQEAEDFDIAKPDLSDEGAELLSKSAMDIYIAAKQNMPQIQAAERRRASAEFGLAAARGNLYPNLSLSGSVGSGYSGNNRVVVGGPTEIEQVPIGRVLGSTQIVVTDQPVFNFESKGLGDQLNDNFNQNIQLNLSIPIFNGLSARSNLNFAKVNQLDADIAYSQISNQLRFDVEQAYVDAKSAMNSYLAASKSVEALKESFKYAEVRFEQGVINAVDFNNIKTQYANAQSSMTNAKYDFVFRTKILDFYLGNPITL